MQKITFADAGFNGFWQTADNPVNKEVAVIVLGGTKGKKTIPVKIGKKFAENGIDSLGMRYWNAEGLPKYLVKVPLEQFESAIEWLRQRGRKKIFFYGVSKGAQISLLCASLMKGIKGVVAVSPSHCVWSGLKGNIIPFQRFLKKAEFTWRGKELPFTQARITYGKAIKAFFKNFQAEISYIYKEGLKNFNEDSVIKVENIDSSIFFIYPRRDLMWPSKYSVEYMISRLKKFKTDLKIKIMEFHKGSHMMIPMNPITLKLVAVERKFPNECRQNRQKAFEATINWINSISVT